MIVTPAEIRAICKHAEEEYPNECCGVVMVRGDEREILRFRNMQDEMHRLHPDRFPRTARNAYYVGLDDHRRIDQFAGKGFKIRVIYHSHPEAGAYFSAMDRAQATGRAADESSVALRSRNGPIWPGVVYVVASVTKGRAVELAEFRWYPVARDFAECARTVVLPLESQK